MIVISWHDTAINLYISSNILPSEIVYMIVVYAIVRGGPLILSNDCIIIIVM